MDTHHPRGFLKLIAHENTSSKRASFNVLNRIGSAFLRQLRTEFFRLTFGIIGVSRQSTSKMRVSRNPSCDFSFAVGRYADRIEQVRIFVALLSLFYYIYLTCTSLRSWHEEDEDTPSHPFCDTDDRGSAVLDSFWAATSPDVSKNGHSVGQQIEAPPQWIGTFSTHNITRHLTSKCRAHATTIQR